MEERIKELEAQLREALQLVNDAPLFLIDPRTTRDRALLIGYKGYLDLCSEHKRKLDDLRQRAGYGQAEGNTPTETDPPRAA